MTPTRSLALVLLALLAACGPAGPGSVHSMGVSASCGPSGSPFLQGQNGLPVRCAPQAFAPH